MPNVDSLNFELILKDDKFNEQIKKDLENAKQLNTQLTNLLEVKAKVAKAQKQVTQAARDDLQATKNANKAKEEQARHEAAMARAAESRKRAVEATAIVEDRRASQAKVNADKEKKAAIDVETAERRKAKAMGQSTKHMQVQSSLLNQMTGLLTSYLSITGGIRLVKDLAAITGEFEMQRRTLQAILGDVEGANAVFDNLKNLAVESPFQFKDLTSYAKQLSAFSIPINELYDTTKMLADVSAGLGVDLGRIILAYGQIRSASFLRGFNIYGLSAA